MPTQLRSVVRALAKHPPWVDGPAGEVLEVCLRAGELNVLPDHSRVLLRVHPDDFVWLNLRRPVFSMLHLRAVLWLDETTHRGFVKQSADTYDWLTAITKVPARTVPEFAVTRLREVLASGREFAWRGPLLAETLADAGWVGEVVDVDANLSHAAMLERLQQPGLPVVSGIGSDFMAWRVRMAMAHGRCERGWVAVDPLVVPRGMISLHARQLDWDDATQQLAAAGWRRPGWMAAWLDLEPEAIEAACERPNAAPGERVVAVIEIDEGALEARVVAALRQLPAGPMDFELIEGAWQAGFGDVALVLGEAGLRSARQHVAKQASAEARERLVGMLVVLADVMRRLGVLTVDVDGVARSALSLYTESLERVRAWVRAFGRTPEALGNVGVALGRVADEMVRRGLASVDVDGDSRSALSLYVESLELLRARVREFGRTPVALRDVSLALHNVAGVMWAQGVSSLEIDGEARSALSLYGESLELAREIVREFGRTPEALRNVSVSLNKVGDAMRAQGVESFEVDGEARSALSLCGESLELRRGLVREFGRTPQSLRDVSVSLVKVGDAMLAQGEDSIEVDGEARSALSLYGESLELARGIVREFGRTPEALRDVSVSLHRVADAMRAQGEDSIEVDGEARSALSLYAESLALARALVRDFGPTPQALRDVSVSLNNVANTMRAQGVMRFELDGDTRSALSLYDESLELFRVLVQGFGPTPERLVDLFDSHANLHEAFREQGDAASAREQLDLAAATLDELDARGWADALQADRRSWLEAQRARLPAP